MSPSTNKVHLLQDEESLLSGLEEDLPYWEDWCEQSAALSKTLCWNSRHAFRKYPHCSHPLRHGSPPFFWTHLTRGFLHIRDANKSRDVMPPHLRPGGDSPFSCGSTFNFHPTWRCTSSAWSRGWIIMLPAHTHSPPKALNSTLPSRLSPTCHHHGYILPVNFNRRTHTFL